MSRPNSRVVPIRNGSSPSVSPTKDVTSEENKSPTIDRSISAQTILETKQNRKRAEADLQLLSNRLQLLRLEEQRALQKVQETRVRAKEILEIKKRKESEVQSRIMQNVNREMEVKANRDRTSHLRDARKAKVGVCRDSLVESKRQVADTLRLQRKEHEISAASDKFRHVSEEENRKKAAAERMRRESIKKRMEDEKRRKQEQLHLENSKKLEEEEQKRLEAENMIAELEQEERMLIERLKKTQVLQEKAITALHKSLEI